MGPKRQPKHVAAHATGTSGRAPGAEMVRKTSIFSSIPESLGHVVAGFTHWMSGPLEPRSAFSTWQMMNPWRRLACHFLPIVCALFVTFGVIQLVGNRYNPRTIVAQHITPNPVQRGSRVFLVATVRDDRQCSGQIHRWITDRDGRIYGLPDAHAVYGYVTPGVKKDFKLSHQLDIPPDIAVGPAVYHSQVERWCNILQEYIWPMGDGYAVPFTVSDKPVLVGPIIPSDVHNE